MFHIHEMISNIYYMRKIWCSYNVDLQNMLLFVKTNSEVICSWLNAEGLSRSTCKKLNSDCLRWDKLDKGGMRFFILYLLYFLNFEPYECINLFGINKTVNCFSAFFQNSIHTYIQKPNITNSFVNLCFGR